jgi:hypothetical protein
MQVKLKNYTTEISAEKSIFEIEALLSQVGASHVMKEFRGDGKVGAIMFRLEGKTYKLPANVEGVNTVLTSNKQKTYRRDGMANRFEQAYRTSWRIIKDWLHSQFSLMASGQASPDEIMLPYMWNGKTTLFEAYKSGQLAYKSGQLALPEAE